MNSLKFKAFYKAQEIKDTFLIYLNFLKIIKTLKKVNFGLSAISFYLFLFNLSCCQTKKKRNKQKKYVYK